MPISAKCLLIYEDKSATRSRLYVRLQRAGKASGGVDVVYIEIVNVASIARFSFTMRVKETGSNE